MDELMRMVRESYDRPTPPTATEIAQSRRRLDAVISPKRRVLRARWAIPAVGLAAAATAAAMLATSLGGSGTTKQGTQALSSRQILLAAAQQAVRTPVGTYWRVHTVGNEILRVSGGYSIETRTDSQVWISPSNDVSDMRFSLAPQTRPLDLAAWKRAGSPTKWPSLGPKPGIIKLGSGMPISFRYTAATKKQNVALEKAACAQVRKRHPHAPYYVCTMAAEGIYPGGTNWQEGNNLAAHPQQIKGAIIDAQAPLAPGPAGLFIGGLGFLDNQPMLPAAQAAVYRFLANLPGVRAIGKVKDAAGQVGDGLAVTTKSPQGDPVEYQAVFDPATHQPLGDQEILLSATGSMKRGTVVESSLLEAIGWTDDTPVPPVGGISESSGK